MEASPKGSVEINTGRLTLRKYTIEDAESMFRNYTNDPEVAKFLSWEAHSSIEVTQSVIQNWLPKYEDENADETFNWAMTLKGTDEVIGGISAVHFSRVHRWCELGYCIARQYWSQGLMTEAVRALIDFFFEEVGLNRIQAHHDVLNPASGKVMEKAGMQLEGTIRQRRMRKDQTFADSHLRAIIREDWEKSRT